MNSRLRGSAGDDALFETKGSLVQIHKYMLGLIHSSCISLHISSWSWKLMHELPNHVQVNVSANHMSSYYLLTILPVAASHSSLIHHIHTKHMQTHKELAVKFVI